mgnify:CR=1 FL=1
MIEKTSIEFVVRNRNGSKSGGQKIKGEIENFDWEKFKNIPNAAAFVKKAYEREARQLMLQLHENKTNVSPTGAVGERLLHFHDACVMM